VTPAARALIDQAWAQRYRDPSQLVALGEGIVAAARDDALATAWGWWHQALGQRARGDAPGGRAATQRAARLFGGDSAGLACCAALDALPRVASGNAAEALALLADDASLPPLRAETALARQFVLEARAMARVGIAQWDGALRDRYAALAAAHVGESDGAIGHALAMLASLQSSLANFDDALRLAEDAMEFCERGGAGAAWVIASMNRLAALVALERRSEGVDVAERLLAQLDRVHPSNREPTLVLLAWAMLRGGQAGRAQALLDDSVVERRRGQSIEWVVVQTELWLAAGHAGRARELAERVLVAGDDGVGVGATPDDWLQLRRAAAAACEAVGDPAGALAHQRESQVLYESQVGRAARARRLTLEIEHELDRERWMRERAQAEQVRLDQLNRALEAASLAKSRFLAAASHDLRQPVHALSLQVAALRPHLDAPVQREMAARIERCVDALSGMFNTLLDLSQMDAGVVTPRIAPVALAPLLARLVEEQASVAEGKGLRLALRVSRGAAQAVAASDAELLARALRNLVVNALKFTHSGGVLLTLRPRGAAWRVEVWDTGIGIAADERSRVFDEFYQVGNEARQREQGLGLGLSIVRRLMLLLDHPLALHSQPGRGTRVAIELPASAGALTSPASPRAPDAPLGLHVAVIEDDLDVRAALRCLLEQWGCRVSDADRAAPLTQTSADAPDVLLADLRLADGRDGLREVAAMRAAWGAALPALVISGDTAPERLRELHASGLPWAHKPLAAEALHAWLAASAAAMAPHGA
jgi:signal transduction histidine kinase